MYIVNLYRGMSKLKLKINVNLPQLSCIVVSVALHSEFERFGGQIHNNNNTQQLRYIIIIFSHTFLYISNKQTRCLCGSPVAPKTPCFHCSFFIFGYCFTSTVSSTPSNYKSQSERVLIYQKWVSDKQKFSLLNGLQEICSLFSILFMKTFHY